MFLEDYQCLPIAIPGFNCQRGQASKQSIGNEGQPLVDVDQSDMPLKHKRYFAEEITAGSEVLKFFGLWPSFKACKSTTMAANLGQG